MMATAKEIADERFARGDITKSEYDDIIQTVGASGISEPDAAKPSMADDETALETGIAADKFALQCPERALS